jgi:hypothetical protein
MGGIVTSTTVLFLSTILNCDVRRPTHPTYEYECMHTHLFSKCRWWSIRSTLSAQDDLEASLMKGQTNLTLSLALPKHITKRNGHVFIYVFL